MKATEPLLAGRLVEFKYVAPVSLDPAAGVISFHTFIANGMFDPDYSGIGHQPLGYDQWLPTFFNHYCVVKSKCTFQAWAPDTTVNANTLVMGINLVDDTTTLAGHTVTSMMERPRCTYKLITNSNSGTATQMVNKTFNAQQFFSRKDVIGSDQLRGSSAGNPQETAVYQCWIGAADVGSNPSTVKGIVTITYTARLLEPRIVNQS